VNCDTASDQMMALRWNSLDGRVFVDGSHMEVNSHVLMISTRCGCCFIVADCLLFVIQFPLQLGDEIVVNSHAPILNMFDAPDLIE
jgi:hypothetical protein